MSEERGRGRQGQGVKGEEKGRGEGYARGMEKKGEIGGEGGAKEEK